MNPASCGADRIFILVAWIGRTDHGEESEEGESKEEIDEGEEESRSGAQKEEGSKICSAEAGETFGEKGRSETQGSGKETGSRAGSADARACTGSVMDAAGQLRVRGQRQYLKTVPLRLRSITNLTARARACAVAF